jgi:hypothetical protein
MAALASGTLAAAWALSLVQPPAPASPGLDQSWRIGLTMAALQHLQFGRDIVFTFGPLGYVLQGIPDPALAVPTALALFTFAAIAGLGAWFALVRRGSWLHKALFGLALVAFGTTYTIEYLTFAGVLALLVHATRRPRLALLVGACVGAAALLGSLSKYTLAVDVLAAAGAVWFVDVVRGPTRRRRASLIACGLALGITAVGVGAAFRFEPAAIARYVSGAAQISGGYSAAMALPGPDVQVAIALLVAAAILAVAVAALRERKPTVLALAAVVLFLTWKHGFVRQDEHIVAYFGVAAVLAPLIGTMVRRPLANLLAVASSVIAIAAFAWSVVVSYGVLPPMFDAARITHGARFLLDPRTTEARLAAVSDAALVSDRLPPRLLARIDGSTVDALPTETALVKANGLRWAPLPVFQSYVAYTPALDALNREALARTGATYILYRYEAIDQRLPFGEMPAATAELFCRYDLAAAAARTAASGEFMLLERSARPSCHASPAGQAQHVEIGSPIAVPEAVRGAFVAATFDLHPTLLARLVSTLWRAPVLRLELRFGDGSIRRYRAVMATLGDGVIVSAAPRDQAEAARYLGGATIPAVRSITVIARPGTYALDGVTFTLLRRAGCRASARC